MATADLATQKRKPFDNTGPKMSPELQAQYLTIRELLNKATTVDAAHRYEMAVLIRQVCDGEGRLYGLHAVERLAKELGYSEESLRMYAMVPKAWPEDAFRKLLQRKTERGRAISWSHFVQLAEVISPQRRNAYLERVIAENLSVRDLKKIIGGKTTTSTNIAAIPSTLRASVRQMTASAQVTVGKVNLWKTAVFERLRNTKAADIDQEFKNELNEALEAQVEAEEACRSTRSELEKTIADIGKRR